MKVVNLLFSVMISMGMLAIAYATMALAQPQGSLAPIQEISPVMKNYFNGERYCTSVYTVTHQSADLGTYAHVYYDGSDQIVHTENDTISGNGQSKVYDVADISVASGYTGSVVISSDHGFTVSLASCPGSAYEISGLIVDALQNPVEGITVTLDSGGVTHTDDKGFYLFDVAENAGDYRVTPSFPGISFLPVYRDVTVPPAAQDQHFSLATSLISGTIRDKNNTPMANVRVTTDKGDDVFTDSQGRYQFSNLSAGTYVVTAIASGVDFVPSNRSVTVPPIAQDVHFNEGRSVYLPLIIR